MLRLLLPSFAIWAHVASGAPLTSPTVQLDSAVVTGVSSGRTSQFLGIPFAQPPVGDLRLRHPQPNSPYTGSINATAYGFSCPQADTVVPILTGVLQEVVDDVLNLFFSVFSPDDEDCLTVNVIAPASATPASKLPVITWIYGGGFESGSTHTYDGTSIVERSIDLGYPAVYVSMNYRLNVFGFLGGKEVKDAGVGNLGLQDQRQALRWIQKYIGAFGGDPTKVTIWGESAGAISVGLHMVANDGNTEGLFRAAFMESGSPIPVGDITHGQKYYDDIVSRTGCAGSPDTLACLRTVPYAILKDAMNHIPGIFAYQSLNLAWLPRADGIFLKDAPQHLVASGSVAPVPFITGDCDDEGTLFSLSTLNVTTDDQFREYIQNTFLAATASSSDMDQVLALYTNDVSEGSPFGTGTSNAITPQYKRIAAFLGDSVFQAPRRYFLQQRFNKQKTWTFLSRRGKTLPFLGSAHGTDLLNVYASYDMTNYLIRFAANLDPNGSPDLFWPQYDTSSAKMLLFQDNRTEVPQTIIEDTFRAAGMSFLTNFTLAHPM